MKFKISLRLDSVANNKINIINSIIQPLEEYFYSKQYGDDVEEILIGLTCANISIGYEHLYKEFPLKYTDYKIIKNKYTGEQIEINKQINFSFNLSNEKYDDFIKSEKSDAEKIISQEILTSLDKLNVLPKKIKDFDKEKFKADMLLFFQERKLLGY